MNKRSEPINKHSTPQPSVLVPVATYPTSAQDGPRAFPIREAFKRIGVKSLKGYELINSGQLQTFCIGRRRYATAEAIATFIERCIAASKESDMQRAEKVAQATRASLLSRKQARAGAAEVRGAAIQGSAAVTSDETRARLSAAKAAAGRAASCMERAAASTIALEEGQE